MFRGVTNISLDAKGRFALPTRYRQELLECCDNQLVITTDIDEYCLLIYPLPYWEDVQRKVEALPSLNPIARRMQRMLIGHATDVDIDGSGRVLLSQPLRDYAKLEKKTVLLGQGKKFELWDEAYWSQRRDSYMAEAQNPTEMPTDMQSLSL